MAEPLVENTIPVLAVSHVAASIRFYREQLGFELDWGGAGDTAHICSVSRDGHPIMLQQRDPVTPGCVWIGGSVLIPIWEAIRLSSEVTVIQRPTNQPWALEMKIQDLDGNVLWFGTESVEGVAFGTEPDDSRFPRS